MQNVYILDLRALVRKYSKERANLREMALVPAGAGKRAGNGLYSLVFNSNGGFAQSARKGTSLRNLYPVGPHQNEKLDVQVCAAVRGQ